MIASALRGILRRLARDEAGAPAVEFAMTLPALALVVFSSLQFGMAFTAYAGVRNAVEVGARYAMVYTGQTNTTACGTTTRKGYPTNDQIRAKVTANLFGVDSSKVSTPTVTLGSSNNTCYIDVAAGYPIALNLGFISTPSYTMTYTRRAYQQ